MQRAAAGLRTDPASRLADLERRAPEWRVWLRLLAEIRAELDDPVWAEPLSPAPGADGAPLLEAQSLPVDPKRQRRLLRRLAAAAARAGAPDGSALRRYDPSAEEAMRLLERTVRQDRPDLTRLSDAAGVDPGTLATLAHLASLPLLRACGRVLQPRVPTWWPHGHCPICGGWPILAEIRGLERTRRLRCGRCAAEWGMAWLCCTYCGEKDHDRLGSLVSGEGPDGVWRVEVCETCRRYLKSLTCLQPTPSFELLLLDLESVELDLAALDRGYSRPEEAGIPLAVRVRDRATRSSLVDGE